ncbi:hypothetical protein KATP_12100 [Kluyvera ascorbata]|nr:hypothetical protein KATP_12100 [Kluyvera ascorbata]
MLAGELKRLTIKQQPRLYRRYGRYRVDQATQLNAELGIGVRPGAATERHDQTMV